MNNGLPFKVLVAEDDADDREFLDDAFLEIGFACEIKKFMNGEMLLRYLDTIEPELYPSLVMLDSRLPGLNAADLLAIFKNDPRYKDIWVVVCTSSLTPAKENEFKMLGAVASFQKGYTREQVKEIAMAIRVLAKEREALTNSGGEMR